MNFFNLIVTQASEFSCIYQKGIMKNDLDIGLPKIYPDF